MDAEFIETENQSDEEMAALYASSLISGFEAINRSCREEFGDYAPADDELHQKFKTHILNYLQKSCSTT